MKTASGKLIAIIFISVLFLVQCMRVEQGENKLPEPKNGSTYVIAHRGVHIGIPENTLPAYQKAIDLDCDFVEIDARSTKDGHIISIHNSTIDVYVDDKKGPINNFTLAEIKALNIGKRIGSEWEGTRVPTVEEILQLCQGKIGIYLDLKEPLVEGLVKLIKKYGMEQSVVWCIPSSRMDEILKVKELCPDCIPMPEPGDEKNVISTIAETQPVVIAPVMDDFSETYVPKAHARGVKVFVDEDKGGEKEWEWILNLGTDGIQTNDPEALIEYLNKRKE